MSARKSILSLVCALSFLAGCGAPEEERTATPTPTGASPTQSPGTSPGTAQNEPGQEQLDDGRHFGFIRSVNVGGRSIAFDVAVYLTGEAAQQAARERGEVTPDDVFEFFVVNDDPRVRDLGVAPNPRIRILSGGGPGLADSTLEGLSSHLPRPDNGFWVEIENGRVVAIEEQYVP
ncbi:MAG: hypothetical protein M3164_07405 [Actinomycetota bacterium]|nr:hypothetical protein [Actinomycetota bacterium]